MSYVISEIDKINASGRKYLAEHPEEPSYNWLVDELDVTTNEHEHYTETLYAIHNNGTAICLRKSETKEGYHWK